MEPVYPRVSPLRYPAEFGNSINHPGILIEYQEADPGKNRTYGQIVAAIGKMEASGLEVPGQCLAVNPWR